MSKIIITTDSGIDSIDKTTMIPGRVVQDGTNSYRDVVEITSKEILNGIKEGHVYKTSSPVMEDYEKTFVKYLEQKYDIIHLSMSSGISEGSVNSANLMASMLDEQYENKIHVVDTLNGATGGTLINEIAQSLVNNGLSTSQVLQQLEIIKKQIQTSFYVPNPEGFIKSGRNKSELCLKQKAMLMGIKTTLIAGIKFRVDFNEEGNLYTKGFFKTKTSSGMMKLVKSLVSEETKEMYDPCCVVIGNLNEKEVNMDEVKDYLENLNYFERIIRQDINGVVAAYGSDDLCGISLVKKNR